MAAAEDGLELQSRVQLLDGPFYEGQYMIGSVNFVKAAGSDVSEADEGKGTPILVMPSSDAWDSVATRSLPSAQSLRHGQRIGILFTTIWERSARDWDGVVIVKAELLCRRRSSYQ